MKVLCTWLLVLSTPWILAQEVGSGVLHGSVTLGDWVVWGQANLSAGTYTLTLEYAHSPVKMTVTSERGKTNVFIPLSILAGTESGMNRICLVHGKDRWRVRSVDLPQLGISLLYLPRNHTPDTEESRCVPIAMSSSGTI